MHRVAVVGAGIGGLAAAIVLAARGIEVTVVERESSPGGKMRRTFVEGRPIDAGPTVLTMRWVFEDLFSRGGASLTDHLSLQPASVLARHAWSADETLDLHADTAASADAIGRFAGPDEARRFRGFCDRAQRVYDTLESGFLRSQQTGPLGLVNRVGWSRLPEWRHIAPMQSMWSALGRHFHDPRLRQLFGRYATYCGSSPYLAPATLMLVAHVERDGVWLVDGGMYRIAQALERVARELGVSFRYDCTVHRIRTAQGRACGLELDDREPLDADAVVFNGDAAALGAGLLGEDGRGACVPMTPGQRSLSALTWAIVGEASGFPLARHTVFFSRDYAAEFDDLVGARRLPQEPTVYVCAQDRDDAGRHGGGLERLFCLVNAPADGDARELDPSEIERCEQRSLALMQRCGLSVRALPDAMERTTPRDFAQMFPGTGGALYGRASHGWRASFQRPGSRTRLPGLYLAGGSTHPGPGVPMAALSGMLAAERVLGDRVSTSRSQPAATAGGMSTRSATTGVTASR